MEDDEKEITAAPRRRWVEVLAIALSTLSLVALGVTVFLAFKARN